MLSPRLRTILTLGILTMVATPAVAEDAKAEKGTKAKGTAFTRIHRDANDKALSMDTAIVRYEGVNEKGEKVFVDLLGAIHIGDRRYYEDLNKEFEKYDAMLYELVAPKGARPEKGTSGLYSPIADMLELSDQIYYIDYGKENFVHADMSFEELRQSMERRDESISKMFFTMIGAGIAQQTSGQGPSDAELLTALLFARNKSLAFKQMLAPQFENVDTATTWLSGPDGSTLITERNKVALDVLTAQIKAGKTKLGIFYGAGHLADMEERLLKDFGMKKTDHRWLVAWDLTGKKGDSAPKESAPKESAPKKLEEKESPVEPAAEETKE